MRTGRVADVADPAVVRRIGIIGLDSSRPRRFVEYLNAPRAGTGPRVTALALGSGERVLPAVLDELCGLGGIDGVAADPHELTGTVDAVIDCTRDGARHRGHVEPLLAGGTSAFVDKPLARSAADADAMIAAARAGRAVLMSCSGYRDAAELTEAASALSVREHVERLEVTGPADPSSAYGGLPYYGIHHVEVALEVLRRAGRNRDGIRPEVTADRTGVQARFDRDGTEIVLTFLPAAPGFSVRWQAGATVTDRPLTLPPDYNERMLDRFVQACASGAWPCPAAELRASVALVEDVVAGL